MRPNQKFKSVKNPLPFNIDDPPHQMPHPKLNVDLVETLSMLNYHGPFTKLLKIPEQYEKIKSFLLNNAQDKGEGEKQYEDEDPPMFLQIDIPQVDGTPTLFVTI